MRPLARWTIGPVSDIGFEILDESVRSFTSIYPEFDCVICHNFIDEQKVNHLGVATHKQEASTVPCKLTPPSDSEEEASGCGWKLAPPRLRPEAHELWIDNDLVIRRRIEEIDEWLASPDSGLISEGLGRCRVFGAFDRFVPTGIHACAGLFGLPPGFDFYRSILFYMPYLDKGTLGGYDEQGLTAAIVLNMPKCIMVPNTQCRIWEDHMPPMSQLPAAIHFVAANRKPWHRGWKSYSKLKKSMIMV